MKRNTLALAGGIGLFVLGAVVTPAARADVCSSAPATVSIAMDIAPTTVNNSLPPPALRQLGALRHAGRILGLYSADLGVNWTTRLRGEGGCRWAAEISVELRLQTRVIYVSNEESPGSCAYTSIIAHERQHEATDEGLVREYRGNLERAAISAALSVIAFPFPAEQAKTAEVSLNDAVSTALKREFAALMAARRARQAAIDTPEEYHNALAAC